MLINEDEVWEDCCLLCLIRIQTVSYREHNCVERLSELCRCCSRILLLMFASFIVITENTCSLVVKLMSCIPWGFAHTDNCASNWQSWGKDKWLKLNCFCVLYVSIFELGCQCLNSLLHGAKMSFSYCYDYYLVPLRVKIQGKNWSYKQLAVGLYMIQPMHKAPMNCHRVSLE